MLLYYMLFISMILHVNFQSSDPPHRIYCMVNQLYFTLSQGSNSATTKAHCLTLF